MNTFLRPAFSLLICLTLLTGLAYPLFVTAAAQGFFPRQANGSLVTVDGQVVGSEWIGQNFTEPEYFWGRLSATGSYPYNAGASGGSNYGAMHSGLAEASKARVEALRTMDSSATGGTGSVPADLGTASGSGLDPEITVAAAEYQVGRIANARGISEAEVRAVITEHRQGKFLGFSGVERVNVLKLNLALNHLR